MHALGTQTSILNLHSSFSSILHNVITKQHTEAYLTCHHESKWVDQVLPFLCLFEPHNAPAVARASFCRNIYYLKKRRIW